MIGAIKCFGRVSLKRLKRKQLSNVWNFRRLFGSRNCFSIFIYLSSTIYFKFRTVYLEFLSLLSVQNFRVSKGPLYLQGSFCESGDDCTLHTNSTCNEITRLCDTMDNNDAEFNRFLRRMQENITESPEPGDFIKLLNYLFICIKLSVLNFSHYWTRNFLIVHPQPSNLKIKSNPY